MEKRKITLSEFESCNKLDSTIDRLINNGELGFALHFDYESVIVVTPHGDEFSASVLVNVTALSSLAR